VHRDLKPANILVSKGTYKIADFGLAKYLQDESQLLKTRVGTPFYMAPQILKNERYTSKCDIWSLGIIFYQLLFGTLPWYATS
jgi:serine/threonine protein kinase